MVSLGSRSNGLHSDCAVPLFYPSLRFFLCFSMFLFHSSPTVLRNFGNMVLLLHGTCLLSQRLYSFGRNNADAIVFFKYVANCSNGSHDLAVVFAYASTCFLVAFQYAVWMPGVAILHILPVLFMTHADLKLCLPSSFLLWVACIIGAITSALPLICNCAVKALHAVRCWARSR